MKEFKVINGEEIKTFAYPTNVKEIDRDWLRAMGDNIKVAPNRSLIALVHIEQIATVVLTFKQRKKEVPTSVVPIFVKAGESDSEFTNMPIGTTLIIPTSSLVNAIHIKVPGNQLSLGAFTAALENDNEAYKRAVAYNFRACFVEFKIIQNYEIAGAYNKES